MHAHTRIDQYTHTEIYIFIGSYGSPIYPELKWIEQRISCFYASTPGWLFVCLSGHPILMNAISQKHSEGYSSNFLLITWRQIFKVKGHWDFTKQLLPKYHKCLIEWNEDFFQIFKSHSEVTVICSTYLAVTQNHNSRTEGEIVTIFHIWLDTDLLTIILGVHRQTVGIVQIFCPTRSEMCEKGTGWVQTNSDTYIENTNIQHSNFRNEYNYGKLETVKDNGSVFTLSCKHRQRN